MCQECGEDCGWMSDEDLRIIVESATPSQLQQMADDLINAWRMMKMLDSPMLITISGKKIELPFQIN